MKPAKTIRGVIVLFVSVILLSGCGLFDGRDYAARDVHVVRSGETLFTIAWRYGRDHQDLARWNNLGDGSLIHPGQVIKLYPPSGSTATASGRGARAQAPLPPIPAGPSPAWAWPTNGKVAVEFGQRPGAGTGVLVAGRVGQPVIAAADGRIVYAGGGLIGYGQLIIIKHNDTYLSAYGYNASLLV
ncbi:MAG: LysM peptidoglycan-binding domain-containing protein, partial [Woeseia sp.]